MSKEKRISLAVRNWIRFHILGKNPICKECGAVMVKKGYPKDFIQAFKCLECGYGSG